MPATRLAALKCLVAVILFVCAPHVHAGDADSAEVDRIRERIADCDYVVVGTFIADKAQADGSVPGQFKGDKTLFGVRGGNVSSAKATLSADTAERFSEDPDGQWILIMRKGSGQLSSADFLPASKKSLVLAATHRHVGDALDSAIAALKDAVKEDASLSEEATRRATKHAFDCADRSRRFGPDSVENRWGKAMNRILPILGLTLPFNPDPRNEAEEKKLIRSLAYGLCIFHDKKIPDEAAIESRIKTAEQGRHPVLYFGTSNAIQVLAADDDRFAELKAAGEVIPGQAAASYADDASRIDFAQGRYDALFGRRD